MDILLFRYEKALTDYDYLKPQSALQRNDITDCRGASQSLIKTRESNLPILRSPAYLTARIQLDIWPSLGSNQIESSSFWIT